MPRAFGWYVSFFFAQKAHISPLLSSRYRCLFPKLCCLTIGSLNARQSTHSPYPYSAEAVASMIKAHIFGESWEAPAWLPKRYLTWATEA